MTIDLAEQSYYFRKNIDNFCYCGSANLTNNIFSPGGASSQPFSANNSIFDQNGIEKADNDFLSLKAISQLTAEAKKQIEKYEAEIEKIKEAQVALADSEENGGNKKTLKDVFKSAGVSIEGLDRALLTETKASVIQSELEKALKKKEDEYENLKKQYFGENQPYELNKINLENIDAGENVILKDKVKSAEKLYDDCAKITKDIKDLDTRAQTKKNDILKSSMTNEQKQQKLQEEERQFNEEKLKLIEKQINTQRALKEARKAVVDFGTLAAKDNDSYGSDGKVKTTTTPIVAPAVSKDSASCEKDYGIEQHIPEDKE